MEFDRFSHRPEIMNTSHPELGTDRLQRILNPSDFRGISRTFGQYRMTCETVIE